MSENTIKTRIQMKNDIEANWDKATGFIPKAGEIIIYNIDEIYSEPRIKIGDGENSITALPFCYTEITETELAEICGVGTNSTE